eukprot:6213498-Pleurochrysis_carterae.AAC.3
MTTATVTLMTASEYANHRPNRTFELAQRALPCSYNTIKLVLLQSAYGIIGATTGNNLGVSGVAGGFDGKPGVALMHLPIANSFFFAREVEALIYAADMGAAVASNSWSYIFPGTLRRSHFAVCVLLYAVFLHWRRTFHRTIAHGLLDQWKRQKA